ncbi:MAG: hypothetical protein II926_06305 [Bacteroidales bacterium]|nr:hypothetical protein [Bacteroidales bacterium]
MRKIILNSIFVLGYVFSLSAQTTTIDITPKGFFGNFELVERVLDNELLALSDLGYVYRSKDFGKTWDVVNTPFDNVWFMSFQEDKKRGYLTGGYNLAFTNDGGYTWENIPLTGIPQNLKIQKAFPKNEDTLFVSVSGKENGMKIYMKSRFAEQWEKVVDELYNTLILNLSTIYFPTPSHGYALGRGYYAETLDGGKTWKKNLLDANTIFRGSILLNNGSILQTYSSTSEIPPQLEGIKWCNSVMYGLERQSNVIVGTSDYEMYYSTDEGESWTTIPFDFSTFIYDISIYNDETFIVVGNYLTSYITTDVGETWTKYVHGGGDGFNNIYCKNENECLITGKTGRVFSTKDGGETWEIQNVHDGALYEIEFPSNEVGYIVGPQILFKTTDGGDTWEKKKLRIVNAQYIDFINENVGYLGYSSIIPSIHKTTDGGGYWDSRDGNVPAIYRNNASGMTKFSFRDENEGVVCGVSTLLHTIDGGETWEVKDCVPENTYPQSILSIGDKGWLLHTNNNAKNYSFDRFFFYDNDFNGTEIFSGVVSDDSGNLQKINDTTYKFSYDTLDFISTDEGRTWEPIYTGMKGQRFFVNENLGYSITNNQIYKYCVMPTEIQMEIIKNDTYNYSVTPIYDGNSTTIVLYLIDENNIKHKITDEIGISNGEPIIIEIPASLPIGSYTLYAEAQDKNYLSTNVGIIVLEKSNAITGGQVQSPIYRVNGKTLYIYDSNAKLYSALGIEIPVQHGYIELKTGVYILVNGNETYKIVIR